MPIWTYFARMVNPDGSALVKIGHSNNVRLRRKLLQTGAPAPLEILGVIAGGRNVEERLHERFHAAHVHGEWYRAEPDLLAYIRRYAKTVPKDVETVRPPRIPQEAHYRISLRVKGRDGAETEHKREEHKDNPRLGVGMARVLRAHPRRASVLITICWLGPDCPVYHGKAEIDHVARAEQARRWPG